ncbi:unnamed protein product [Owenia fusiformis]|uniref:Methionine--tRNA ligase, mitochondrial n=1 Tax=Owenia fusiformis TaxID=6347 RepID=A0A8S4PQE5_OWEFU|nr:unnamed protein product [Owenia fusiformis]
MAAIAKMISHQFLGRKIKLIFKLKLGFRAVHQSSQFSITTPIFYVNAAPHIGHMYTAVLADTIHRWQHLLGRKSYLYTGTDEHGLKIQQSALRQGVEPLEHCNTVSQTFRDLFTTCGIDHSDFVRTTEPRHRDAVQNFWGVLESGGHIYKGTYEGWYCTNEEAFLAEEQTHMVDEGGTVNRVSLESGHPVQWTIEENYLFRLSSFQQPLLELVKKEGFIQPSVFKTIVLGWLESGLPDLSVSRQRSRLPWGIQVPGDSAQTIYVWLDALVNYLTVSGYPGNSTNWPISCHVIGKDILKFHAIYWPAFLIAAKMEPPKHIFCHSHWTVEDRKMSKSLGNVVDPFDRIQKYTSDGLRYFLLRNGVPHFDCDYSDVKVIACLNDELCNNLGNLLSRSTAPSLNPEQTWAPSDASWEDFLTNLSDEDESLINQLVNLPEVVSSHMDQYNIYKAMDSILRVLRDTNAFFQRRTPWNDRKLGTHETIIRLNNTLHCTYEILHVCGILLQPMVPNLSNSLLSHLGIPSHSRTYQNATRSAFHRIRIGETGKERQMKGKRFLGERKELFPRILTEKPQSVQPVKSKKKKLKVQK